MKKISLFEPNITKLEKKMVLKSLEKNQISTHGYFNNLFEAQAKKITKSKYNLATNSGSAGLLIGLKSLGIKKNEIVLTQSYTFAATTNAIILNGSIPLLLDISSENLNIDLIQLENFLIKKTFKRNNYIFHKQTKKKISCICLVFTLGIIPDLKQIKILSKKYKLKIIFDAACAFGNYYRNQSLTKFGDIAVYSFNGNKNFTTGGGGLICTESNKYYNYSKQYSENGKKNTYEYIMSGFNLKMNSINAALGLAQIKRFNIIKNNKIKISNTYKKNLKNIEIFNCKYPWGKYLPWMNFCLIKNKNYLKKIVKKLKKSKIMVNNFWIPMHKQPIKKNFILTKFSATNYLYERILVLPSSTNLKLSAIKRISNIVNKV